VATVLAAMAEGTLSPGEGSAIGNALSLQCRVLEVLSPYEYICNAWTKEPAYSSSIRSTKYRD
jgi:hypothetical protein